MYVTSQPTHRVLRYSPGSVATFPVTLSVPNTQTVTVKYATVPGVAVEGEDFVPTSGMLTFPPDETTQFISVPTVHDAFPETPETFGVSLSDPSNALIADHDGVATIRELGWLANTFGEGGDPAMGVALDGVGNVYVSGYFAGTTTFVPTVDGNVLTLDSDGGASDAFLAKLNPNGEFIWAKRLGGPGRDEAYRVAVNDAGDVYVTGFFGETATFDALELTSVGGGDVFIAKYDTNGDVQWATRAGGSEGGAFDDEFGFKVELTADAVYLVGEFSGDPDPELPEWVETGAPDGFVARLDPDNGHFVWARNTGATARGLSIAKDPSLGGDLIYVSSNGLPPARYLSSGALDYNWTPEVGVGGVFVYEEQGDHSLYVSGAGNLTKLDSDGKSVWQVPTNCGVRGVDSEGVYLELNWYESLADFDPLADRLAELTPGGQYDHFLAKLDHNGNFLAARQIARGVSDELAHDLAVRDGDIYIAGWISSLEAHLDTGTEFVQPAGPRVTERAFVLKTTQHLGGLFGRAFIDLDGNGNWDAADMPLPGSWMSVNDMTSGTQTEANGEFNFPPSRAKYYL